MQLSKAIEGYIISTLAEGYSQLTLNAYRSALTTMQELIGDKEVELTPYTIAFTPHSGIFEMKNESIFRRKRLFHIIELITGGNRDWTT